MGKKKGVLKWIAAGAATILALVVLALFTLSTNLARPWINKRVSETIGRPFVIQGDLSLSWIISDEPGQRVWVPWPRLTARDVSIANPEWASTGPTMATIGEVSFSLNPMALLRRQVVIPSLLFDEPNLLLERDASGRNNWTFRKEEMESRWEVVIQNLVLVKGTARLVDVVKKADIRAELYTLDETGKEGYGVGWKANGTFNGETVDGSGKAGSVLSLQTQTEPYPVQADMRFGRTRISLEGTLTKPSDLAALEFQLGLSGDSMAHLYPIMGVMLPDTPPFATHGRLSGSLGAAGWRWLYEKFSGKVGSSDLSGTFEYRSRESRPLLTGNLTSNLLRLEDLAPLIGAGSSASKARRGETVRQPPGKVLPAATFRTERWNSIDADVTFTGRRIVHDKDLPIDNLEARFLLKDGILNLNPLNFGVAGGTFRSNINLDASEGPIRARMLVEARHLRLSRLFPTFQLMKTSLGEVNGAAALTGRGNSVAALLGSSNGEIRMLINQGTISKLLLETMGLNVGSIILTTIFGDRQVNINCLVSDFVVVNGLAGTRIFIVDTDDATVNVDGQINMAQEQLNLAINPKTKGIRVLSLRAPLYVTGTFKKPDISLDKGVLALKAGSAALLAAVTPIAALVPLINLGPQKDNQCVALIKEASEKPVKAPPPEQQPVPARPVPPVPAQPLQPVPAQPALQ